MDIIRKCCEAKEEKNLFCFYHFTGGKNDIDLFILKVYKKIFRKKKINFFESY